MFLAGPSICPGIAGHKLGSLICTHRSGRRPKSIVAAGRPVECAETNIHRDGQPVETGRIREYGDCVRVHRRRSLFSDTPQGQLGGKPYFRTGFLGYDSMDKRCEWVTADNQTPILMSYHAADGSGVAQSIEMTETFTDPGVTGEANVGKSVAMRTHIEIESNDRNTYDLFFTPPGGAEMLVDLMVFERAK